MKVTDRNNAKIEQVVLVAIGSQLGCRINTDKKGNIATMKSIYYRQQ